MDGFREFRSFVHVAEAGSISLAAERLHLAQPAVTRHIQALETKLGALLFRRHGRGVALTEQGEALLPRAVRILWELEKASDEVASKDLVLAGEVSFAAPPAIADVLCGGLIEKFSLAYPHVKLRVVAGFSGYILDWLERGLIDVGMLYEGGDSKLIKMRPLVVENLFYVTPRGEGGLGPVNFAEVLKTRLVLPSRQHALRILLNAMADRMGLTIEPVVETDSLTLQVDLVKRGLGATILPPNAIFPNALAGALSARMIVEPEITRRVVLASPVRYRASSAVQRFEAMVKAEVERLVLEGAWRGSLVSPPPPVRGAPEMAELAVDA